MSRIPGGPPRPGFPPPSRLQLTVAAPSAAGPSAPLEAGSSRRALPSTTAAGDTAPMTAVEDGMEHEVAAEDLRAGSVFGRYRALCGVVIDPVALTVPAGVPCRSCAVEVAPGPEPVAADARRSRRAAASWLRGLRARTARRDLTGHMVEPGDVAA